VSKAAKFGGFFFFFSFPPATLGLPWTFLIESKNRGYTRQKRSLFGSFQIFPDHIIGHHYHSTTSHHIFMHTDTVTVFIYYINSLCHIILESYQITFEDSQEIFKSTSSWTHLISWSCALKEWRIIARIVENCTIMQSCIDFLISMMDWLFSGTFHWLVACRIPTRNPSHANHQAQPPVNHWLTNYGNSYISCSNDLNSFSNQKNLQK
jgi:hypothetical protein